MPYTIPTPSKPTVQKQDGERLPAADVMQIVNAIKSNADLMVALATFVLTFVDATGELLIAKLPQAIPRENLPEDYVDGTYLYYDVNSFTLSLHVPSVTQLINTVMTNNGYPPLNSNQPPVVSNVSISGTAQVGKVLTGYATNSDSAGSLIHKWYRATSSGGAGRTLINGATGATYTQTLDDLNKYLQYEPTPVAANGTTTGTAVASAYTSQVIAAAAPGGYAAFQGTGAFMAVSPNGTTTRTSGQYNNDAYLRSTMKVGATTEVVAAKFRFKVTGSAEEGMVAWNKDNSASGDPALLDIGWKLTNFLQLIGEQKSSGTLIPYGDTQQRDPSTISDVELLLMSDGSIVAKKTAASDGTVTAEYTLPAGTYDPVGAYVEVTAYLATSSFVQVETWFANPVPIGQ